jgi:hypothetical protein
MGSPFTHNVPERRLLGAWAAFINIVAGPAGLAVRGGITPNPK